MPRVFIDSSEILSRSDQTRRIHIVIQDSSGVDMFKDTFLMNFELDITSDFMVNKSLDHGFIYNTFGKNPVYITVTGLSHHQGDLLDPTNPGFYGGITVEDPESVFNRCCITSDTREMCTITTNYNGQAGSVYKGYMVKFKKNPMNQDKINGYSFVITFICVLE